MQEYHSIKWVDENTATRHTKEVSIKCIVEKCEAGGYNLLLSGHGDFEHHLVEDTCILLKKVSEKYCGGNHG